MIGSDIGELLFQAFLSAEYSFHIKYDQSYILSLIATQVEYTVSSIYLLFQIFTSLFVSFAVIVSVLAYNPIFSAFVFSLIVITYLSIAYNTNIFLTRNGQAVTHSTNARTV